MRKHAHRIFQPNAAVRGLALQDYGGIDRTEGSMSGPIRRDRGPDTER